MAHLPAGKPRGHTPVGGWVARRFWQWHGFNEKAAREIERVIDFTQIQPHALETLKSAYGVRQEQA